MKNLFLLLILTISYSCSHHEDAPPIPEIDKLPPATQTGANTFGCLLDGKAFTPGNRPNPFDCNYQYVDGGYYFSLQANRDINNTLILLGCGTSKKQIFEGETYLLNEFTEGNAYGQYFYGINFYRTNNIYTGELKITKLDQMNYIVSGTFWYDIIDFYGVIHHITNGRFDTQYTN